MSTFTFFEPQYRESIQNLIKCQQSSPENCLNYIRMINSMRGQKDGHVKVTYSRVKYLPDEEPWGRYYANCPSLQSTDRAGRYIIAMENESARHLTEYDMQGAADRIQVQLFAKHDIDCPNIRKYLHNREYYHEKIMKGNRTKAKKRINTARYGHEEMYNKYPEIADLYQEYAKIQHDFYDKTRDKMEFEKFHRYIDSSSDPQHKKNPHGTFLSFVLQDVESRLLAPSSPSCFHQSESHWRLDRKHYPRTALLVAMFANLSWACFVRRLSLDWLPSSLLRFLISP